MEKKQKDLEKAISDMMKERERDKEEAQKREKELMKRISDLTNELNISKAKVGELMTTVDDKNFEIKTMQDRVQEVQEIMEKERRKHQERIQEIESDYVEKERMLNEKLKRDMHNLIQEQIREI